MKIAIAFVLLAALAGRVGAAETAAVQCFVNGFRGKGTLLHVERGEERIPVVSYLPLHVGDRVRIEDPQGEVLVRCGGQDVAIPASADGYVVDASGAAPNVAINLLRWASDFLAEWSGDASLSDPTEVVLRGRDEARWPLEVPLLTSRPAMVVSGRQWLALGWRGGTPPYEVRVYDSDRRLVLAGATHLEEAHARLALAAPLQPGLLEIEVADEGGRYVRDHVRVVDGKDAPRPPEALRDGGASDPARGTVRAAWIASSLEGIFALEAYQAATELATGHLPARQLLQALRMGQTPAPPP